MTRRSLPLATAWQWIRLSFWNRTAASPLAAKDHMTLFTGVNRTITQRSWRPATASATGLTAHGRAEVNFLPTHIPTKSFMGDRAPDPLVSAGRGRTSTPIWEFRFMAPELQPLVNSEDLFISPQRIGARPAMCCNLRVQQRLTAMPQSNDKR